jgi:hypothetical protein
MELMGLKFKVTDTDFDTIWIHFYTRSLMNHKVLFFCMILNMLLTVFVHSSGCGMVPVLLKKNCNSIFVSVAVLKVSCESFMSNHHTKVPFSTLPFNVFGVLAATNQK